MRFFKGCLLVILTLVLSCSSSSTSESKNKIIKIGLIGLDTSHAPAFTKILNDTTSADFITGAKVVCAYAGGSPDVEASYTRVEKFTARIRDEFKVEIVPDIETLVKKVDAVIINSVDGRVHLEQAKPVIAAKKPFFVDKPMAANLAEAKEIFRLANEAGVPCFSASSLRYMNELVEVLADTSLGPIVGCDIYAPCKYEPHHPDLFWYGVHGVEMLFTVMGPECVSLSRTQTEGTDVVTGQWQDGRLGTFRGIREGESGYGATIFFEKGIRSIKYEKGSLYTNLLNKVITFFQTGQTPIPQEDTVAIFAFMQAAETSKEKGGSVVPVVK